MQLTKQKLAEIMMKVNKDLVYFQNPSCNQTTETFNTMDVFTEVFATFHQLFEDSEESKEYMEFMEKISTLIENETP